jgi:plasmid stabilization system protein ParE
MISFKLRIRDTAFEDLQIAVDYYSTINPALGERFFGIFENALEILKINPYFQVRFDDIRSLPLHKFPYSIYFDVDQKRSIINIYAVVHQAADPDTIAKRLKIT